MQGGPAVHRYQASQVPSWPTIQPNRQQRLALFSNLLRKPSRDYTVDRIKAESQTDRVRFFLSWDFRIGNHGKPIVRVDNGN